MAADAGSYVLAPSEELAAALLDALERAHLQAGREVWPTPKVRDFGGWLRDRYAARQLADATLPRCLSDFEERELWREVLTELGEPGQAGDAGAAVRAARGARRAIFEYGIPWGELQRESSEETRSFLSWNRRLEERCRALRCITADSLLNVIDAPVRAVVWIDSPAWRPVARRWLQRHGHMLTPAKEAAQLLAVRRCASPDAELAAIADWAAATLREQRDARLWICIPDLRHRRAQAVDAFDALLAPRRFALQADHAIAPYAIAGGNPLSEYAPVRVALDCLAASDGPVAFAKFSALLRSPYLHETAADAGSAALLDVELRTHAPHEGSLPAWLELARRVARRRGLSEAGALPRLRVMGERLAQLRGAHRLGDWAAAWAPALDAGPWSLRARWSSTEYQAAERFRELIRSLALADALFGSRSRGSAQRMLHRAAQETTFQPQTGVPAIWISGQAADPWLNYHGLWIAGCGSDRWPPGVDPVALLPARIQRKFGLIAASAESQLAAAQELQRRWLQRAPSCVFSHADAGDGRSSAPSVLLPPASAGQADAADARARPHWYAQLQRAPRLEQFIDERAPPVQPHERTRGVSTLRAQSRCAFRGFAESRMATRTLQAPVPGFSPSERGELVHDALEHVWSVLGDSSTLLNLSAADEQTLLASGIRHALRLATRRRDPGVRWRRRERVRLAALLTGWLSIERRRAPFKVESLEQAVQTAQLAGLSFRVRIDRADTLADGSVILIDYKTGNAHADWRGERPDNPQLPLYALMRPHAVVAVAYGSVNAANLQFVAESERRDLFKPGRPTELEGRKDFAALIAVWGQRLELLAADFAAGRAAVAPTVAACRSCGLQGLCRVPGVLQELDANA